MDNMDIIAYIMRHCRYVDACSLALTCRLAARVRRERVCRRHEWLIINKCSRIVGELYLVSGDNVVIPWATSISIARLPSRLEAPNLTDLTFLLSLGGVTVRGNEYIIGDKKCVVYTPQLRWLTIFDPMDVTPAPNVSILQLGDRYCIPADQRAIHGLRPTTPHTVHMTALHGGPPLRLKAIQNNTGHDIVGDISGVSDYRYPVHRARLGPHSLREVPQVDRTVVDSIRAGPHGYTIKIHYPMPRDPDDGLGDENYLHTYHIIVYRLRKQSACPGDYVVIEWADRKYCVAPWAQKWLFCEIIL